MTRMLLFAFVAFLGPWSFAHAQNEASNDATPPGLEFPLPAGGFGRFDGPAEKVVFFGSYQIAVGQRQGRLSVRAEIVPNWHIYSLTQPRGGPLKSTIKVEDSPQFRITGPFQPDRDPHAYTDKEVFVGVRIEEHEEEVVFTAPIEVAEGVDVEKLKVKLFFNGQVCETNGACVPLENRLVEIEFKGFYGAGEYRAEGSHVAIQGYVAAKSIVPGSTVDLVLTAKPDSEWHIYAYEERQKVSVYSPTLIALTKASGWEVGKPKASDQPVKKEFDKKTTLYYHEQPVSWTIPLKIPKDAKPGKHTITGFRNTIHRTCK